MNERTMCTKTEGMEARLEVLYNPSQVRRLAWLGGATTDRLILYDENDTDA